MFENTNAHLPKPTSSAASRLHATALENSLTVGFGLWLMIGFFVDGYAHGNLTETIEDFFTPWHALLYSGFMATALWVIWVVYRRVRLGLRGFAAIPLGYDWALVGAGLFGFIAFAQLGISGLILRTGTGVRTQSKAPKPPRECKKTNRQQQCHPN